MKIKNEKVSQLLSNQLFWNHMKLIMCFLKHTILDDRTVPRSSASTKDCNKPLQYNSEKAIKKLKTITSRRKEWS